MDVRVAAKGDLPAIRSLSKTTPWEKADFLKRQVDLGHVSVAVEQDIIYGFIVWNREFFEQPFIWLVVVDEARRRRGIGSKLFEAVEAHNSSGRLYTSTNRSNGAMAAFLTRRGYRVVGEIDLDPGDPEVFYRLSVDSVSYNSALVSKLHEMETVRGGSHRITCPHRNCRSGVAFGGRPTQRNSM